MTFSLQVKCSTTELHRRLLGVSIFCNVNSARDIIINQMGYEPAAARRSFSALVSSTPPYHHSNLILHSHNPTSAMHSRIATCAIVALLAVSSSVEAFVHQPAPLADASGARRTDSVTQLQILRMSADGADADGVMNKYSR